MDSKATVVSLATAASPVYCFYGVSKFKGTTETLPRPVSATFSAQTLKLLKELAGYKDAPSCPKKAALSASVYFYVPLGEEAEASIEGEVR